MNPLIRLVAVLAVEVSDPARETVHAGLMQPFRRAYIDPVAGYRKTVDRIAVLSQIGDQVAAYIPGFIAHLCQNIADLGGEEIEGRVYHATRFASRFWLFHEALDSHVLVHASDAVRRDVLIRPQLLQSHCEQGLMLMMELDDALQVDVDEVIA